MPIKLFIIVLLSIEFCDVLWFLFCFQGLDELQAYNPDAPKRESQVWERSCVPIDR